MKTGMNISEEDLEKIEQYLNNQLTGDSLTGFEARMAEDPEWNEKVNHVKLLLIGIKEASLEKDLKKIGIQREGGRIRNIRTKSRSRFLPLLAASVALLVIVFSVLRSGMFMSEKDRLFSEFFTPETGLITSMSITDNYDFERAMVDFKAGEYNKALQGWLSLKDGNEGSDTLNYFIGSAYIALENTQDAIPFFRKTIQQTDGAFYHDAQWYLGLCLLKEGNTQEAVSHLKESDHKNKEELLKKLNK